MQKTNISEHITYIVKKGKLEKESVIWNFRRTGSGIRNHTLDMIVSRRYKVESSSTAIFDKKKT